MFKQRKMFSLPLITCSLCRQTWCTAEYPGFSTLFLFFYLADLLWMKEKSRNHRELAARLMISIYFISVSSQLLHTFYIIPVINHSLCNKLPMRKCHIPRSHFPRSVNISVGHWLPWIICVSLSSTQGRMFLKGRGGAYNEVKRRFSCTRPNCKTRFELKQ